MLKTHTVKSQSPRIEGYDRERRDIIGCRIFSEGELGAAHVLSHSLADSGRPDLGYRLLGNALRRLDGSGSQWIHLQFHMGIFEIETGRWPAALTRLRQEIMPASRDGDDSLTDAPALCWRLALAAPVKLDLPWQVLRRQALNHLDVTDSPFTFTHHLLALAGAKDRWTIDHWIRRDAFPGTSVQRQVLRLTARALLSYANRSYQTAAEQFSDLIHQFHLLGGSSAQNDLIPQFALHCRNLASRSDSRTSN